MPIASEVPRVATASSTPNAAHTTRISQPAASARATSQPDGQSTGAPSACAIAKLATAPAAKATSTNGPSTTPRAASFVANTRSRPGRCVNRVLSVSQA